MNPQDTVDRLPATQRIWIDAFLIHLDQGHLPAFAATLADAARAEYLLRYPATAEAA